MAQVELIMPKMGESIMEATILKWLKQVGDSVELDEPVLEIATDKVDSEVPSPVAGTLVELNYKEGDTVEIGKAIAIIATGQGAGASDAAAPATTDERAISAPQEVQAPDPGPAPQPAPAAPVAEQQVTQTPQPVAGRSPEPAPAPAPIAPGAAVAAAEPAEALSRAAVIGTTQANGNGAGRFYSPLVLNIARREHIGMAELENIPGTGLDGRVSKKDILAYVQQRQAQAPGAAGASAAVSPPPAPAAPLAQAPTPSGSPAAAPVATGASPAPPTPAPVAPARTAPAAPAKSVSGDIEVIEMDRMRKLIAEHMVRSKQTSPHVTSFVEADMTPVVQWREKVKREFLERHGEKITFTPIFVEAIVKAIQDFPMVNVSVEGDRILRKKAINIGMATALPNGNLIVPVIKNADQLNLVGLTKQVNDLAARARSGKLQPHEIEGGTYSITNVGTFGNVMGTPIINQPQVAIMAFGAIRKKPAVIETEQGDFIGIRHMMFLSHSYDHRVVDGMMGGSFLRRVADYLEAFDTERDL